jgi:hypothetical protein
MELTVETLMSVLQIMEDVNNYVPIKQQVTHVGVHLATYSVLTNTPAQILMNAWKIILPTVSKVYVSTPVVGLIATQVMLTQFLGQP